MQQQVGCLRARQAEDPGVNVAPADSACGCALQPDRVSQQLAARAGVQRTAAAAPRSPAPAGGDERARLGHPFMAQRGGAQRGAEVVHAGFPFQKRPASVRLRAATAPLVGPPPARSRAESARRSTPL